MKKKNLISENIFMQDLFIFQIIIKKSPKNLLEEIILVKINFIQY